jgi:DNA polymerase
MSRRAELYRVVRDLKKHLRWQQASGAAGSVAASPQAREVFEAKREAREKAKLDRLKRSLSEGTGAETGARSSRPGGPGQGAPSPDQRAPKKPAPKKSAPKKSAPKQADSVDSTRFNPFDDKVSDSDAGQSDGGPANGGKSDGGQSSTAATPWKSGGSRPTQRFGGRKEPEASQNEQASKQKQASKKQQAANQKQTPTENQAISNSGDKSNSSDNSQPPVDYDSRYPEASGMAPVDSYDPSREPIESKPIESKPNESQPAAESKAPTPKKDPSEMDKAEKLEFLQEYLGDCQRCGLCEERTNIVFGVGDPEAKLVFVGEAPGYNEDQKGEPFVGKAGKLLDDMIVAMGLEREDVYICNVIKCRPPENRDPRPEEIKECAPFLRKQLGVIEPTVIVTLGKFASQFLTGEEKAMGAMRGRWHEWEGVAVMPTYHPAYLLREEDQKRKTWNDLQMVMERLGLK